MSDAERRRLLISGRVQGVFYREGLRRQATAVGVHGSARNLADGRVEVILEGGTDAIEHLIAWCRSGPPNARVDTVEVTTEPCEGVVGFVTS